ncbi:hypothetical protein Fmac_010501 [Flemingia macrophylla]|uniref:Uncharacterized protein n=1 Tax=Flemingia macrophylla TaxID=520843 RepID=A0ABD1MJT1_9FABA
MSRLEDELRHLLICNTIPLDAVSRYGSIRRVSLSFGSHDDGGGAIDDALESFADGSDRGSSHFHERSASLVDLVVVGVLLSGEKRLFEGVSAADQNPGRVSYCNPLNVLEEGDPPKYWFGSPKKCNMESEKEKEMVSMKKDLLRDTPKEMKLFDPRSFAVDRSYKYGFMKCGRAYLL